MAQFKPSGYQRLAESDDLADHHEMRPMTESSAAQPQPPQQAQPAPPYLVGYAPAPATLQQANNSNVVVATQPTITPPVTVVEPRLKSKPTVMIVTIVLTAVCLIQGCWPALVCLAPALIAAVVGFSLSDSGSAEQRHTARAFHAVAVCCNIASAVYYAMAALALIITVASIFGTGSNYENCYNSCNNYDSNGYQYCQGGCY